MQTYKEFHGEIEISNIGKHIREILKQEKDNFKILTGYGSTSGTCKSKAQVLKSLEKLRKENLIKGYLSADDFNRLITPDSIFYQTKLDYSSLIKNDDDKNNPGIIYVFIK